MNCGFAVKLLIPAQNHVRYHTMLLSESQNVGTGFIEFLEICLSDAQHPLCVKLRQRGREVRGVLGIGKVAEMRHMRKGIHPRSFVLGSIDARCRRT